MNCQQFEQLIIKLSCDLPLEPALRVQALAHAATCESCGRRLANQRYAENNLQALAIEEQSVAAPAHIGASLQAAFAAHTRQQQRAQKSFAAWLDSIWQWRMYAPVAALLLLAMLVTILFWREQANPSAPSNETANQMQATVPAAPAPAIEPTIAESVPATQLAPSTSLKRRLARRGHPTKRAVEEYGTLLSLMPFTASEPDEVQQVVRMQIPRATLRLWGLPVNEESSSEQVSAEVTFSENGVARAIRLHNE